MTRWEYRVTTTTEDKPGCTTDSDISQRLTNLALADTPEQCRADGWEIFTVRELDDGDVRIYMKRPVRQEG